MEQTVVNATPGRKLGTRPSKRLRAEGKLPGVVYGLGQDPITVSVIYNDLRDALKTAAGLNTVLQLNLEGDVGTETVIVRSVQRDPIKRLVTHADFLRVDPDIPITVKVPISLTGEAVQVVEDGGLIEQNMFEIEVLVSPLRIPEVIEADISSMTLDTRISVGDLNLPDGVTSLVPDEISVVAPVVSRAAKMMEDLEEAEALEALEAEGALEGEGGEGGESDGDSAEGSEGGDE